MSAQQHLITSALLAERRAEDERAARQAAMQKPARPPIAANRQWSLRMPRLLGRTRRAVEAA